MNLKERLKKLEAIQAKKAAQQSKVVVKSRLAELIAEINDPDYVREPEKSHVPKPKPKDEKDITVLDLILENMIEGYWAE